MTRMYEGQYTTANLANGEHNISLREQVDVIPLVALWPAECLSPVVLSYFLRRRVLSWLAGK